MTRTASPARTSRASASAVASTDPGAIDRDVRPDRARPRRRGPPPRRWSCRGRGRPRCRRPPPRRPRRAPSAKAPEHRRGPMERQRLVDGPDPPARLALADRGEGRADRRRVVAVVVVDHDAGRLALPLESSADPAEGPQPGRDRPRASIRGRCAAPATARAFAALCRPPSAGGRTARRRARRDRRPRWSCRPRRPWRSGPGRPSPGRRRSCSGRGCRAGSRRAAASRPRRRRRRPRAARRGGDRRRPRRRIADVRDEGRPGGHPAQPRLERVADGRPVREDVRVVPLRPVRTATSGR